MTESETVIVESLSEEILTDISIDCMTESAAVKSILLAVSALKMYCLSFKIRKIAAEVLKHDFSCMRLLCWFKIVLLSVINVILTFEWVYAN